MYDMRKNYRLKSKAHIEYNNTKEVLYKPLEHLNDQEKYAKQTFQMSKVGSELYAH